MILKLLQEDKGAMSRSLMRLSDSRPPTEAASCVLLRGAPSGLRGTPFSIDCHAGTLNKISSHWEENGESHFKGTLL